MSAHVRMIGLRRPGLGCGWPVTEDLAHRPHRRLRQVLTKAGKIRADILAKKLPKRAWQQCSAGNGARGLRFYDWAMNLVGSGPGRHQLLFRRNRRTGELAFCRRYSGRRRPRGRSRSAGPPERHADRHPSARVPTRRMRRCRRGRQGFPGRGGHHPAAMFSFMMFSFIGAGVAVPAMSSVCAAGRRGNLGSCKPLSAPGPAGPVTRQGRARCGERAESAWCRFRV